MGNIEVARHRRRAWRSGAAAVEFALVVPLLLMFILGLFEFVRLVMLHQALADAAREGVRVAALATTTQPLDVESKIRRELAPIIGAAAGDPLKVRITTAPAALAGVPSETPLTVTVEIDYADATWVPRKFLALSPQLSAEARRERE